MACRKTQPTEVLVRYGASADGGVQVVAVGGRGAWICRSGDEAHDQYISDGLQRGLKVRIVADDLNLILNQRAADRIERG